ncbi:DnaJ family domain-containing protein [Pseudogracilibacillus auburnensis]|uniref:Uncharacterized protein DUF1992 n=1 Tax=Pseudogracilibacillus auburnensis TaxID=1494959 RepID=A0A2V3VNQ6_9BACI|nr:DnaJ family domain-containing protein [Pseudogracilibacillus auburnensis]PXW82491.1 uncharacterized protein DUF1992 [Pseudogracilibacillus auburnensis]
MEKKYNDLIGDILKRSGDDMEVEGKGKPLPKNYLEMDLYQNFQKIAKDAGFLPEWLKLQKEITSLIHSCTIEEDLIIINEKIEKYNIICPPPFQKSKITMETLEKEKRNW